MEVTALCIRLVITVLMLLVAKDQDCYCAEKHGAAFIRVVPNRLQLFEYDSIICDCEGFNHSSEWRVMRKIMGVTTICNTQWETARRPCIIRNAFESDSGEYWCEAKGGERSDSVHISVTAGSVILESPALPVMEGEAVTLRCSKKNTSSVYVAYFYKDGSRTATDFEGKMTIQSVSKSDEGLYKCKIMGGEESAESWLSVRASPFLHDEKHPSHHHSFTLFILLIIVAVSLVALLLLVVGPCLCGKHRVLACISSKTSVPRSQSGEAQTVSGLTSVHPQRDMYSLITAHTSNTETSVATFTETPVINAPSAGTSQHTTDENAYYSTVD